MKRDMDFVRKLIIDFSEGVGKTEFSTDDSRGDAQQVNEDEKYLYHLEIMRQAGLIRYKEQVYFEGAFLTHIPKLTWMGQDFLSAIEDDGLWSKTKDAMKKKGLEVGKVSFDTMLEFAKFKARETLGLI